jgi:type I restriction enzyme S subunit
LTISGHAFEARQRLIQENELPPIPDNWDVQRFRFLFRESKEKNGNQPVGEMLSVSEYHGVVPKDYEHDEQRRTDDELQSYRVVRPGQLAVNTMWLNHLGLGVSEYLGHVSPAYAVYDVSGTLDRRFVHHLMRSHYYLKIYLRYLYGIRPNSFQIKADDWNSIPVIVPPIDAQKAIADFLDRETAHIDALIGKKQRLVDVIAEGLAVRLEAATSPSEAPFEQIVPFKWICRVVEGQVDPTDKIWSEKPLIAPNHIQSGTGRLLAIESAEEQGAISGKYAFPKGAVLYSKIRPALAKACIAPEAGMCSADMYPITPNRDLLPEFLLMQLLSRRFTDWATLESMRVAMPKINRETLGRYRFWVPPKETQRALVERFTLERKRIDNLTDNVLASIDRLRDFRASLITAAVTGQIDVSEWSKRGEGDRRLDAIQEEMTSQEAPA